MVNYQQLMDFGESPEKDFRFGETPQLRSFDGALSHQNNLKEFTSARV